MAALRALALSYRYALHMAGLSTAQRPATVPVEAEWPLPPSVTAPAPCDDEEERRRGAAEDAAVQEIL